MRAVVLHHIAKCGARGATREEIAAALKMKLQTVCGRVRELVLAEIAKEDGDTRDGRKIVRAK